MILQTARNYLAPYVDNGSDRDLTTVRDTINEAGRRLYISGDYLGLMRRWAVTVAADGTFSMPVGCATLSRVAELPAGMSHSSVGTPITQDASAFVFDSGTILRVNEYQPDKFRVIGPYPQAVDVMGKVEWKDAVSNIDTLIVDDLDALKLMILAIWRENNGNLDISAELEGRSKEHMATKTYTAVENAKRALYQNTLATAQVATRGYTRANVALTISGGDRRDDARIAKLVDDAEKRLMTRLSLWAGHTIPVTGDYIAIPRELESAPRLTIDDAPTNMRGIVTGYVEYRMGAAPVGNQVIYLGEFALHTDLPAPGKLMISAAGNCRGIQVVIEGLGANREKLTEIKTVDGGSSVETTHTYAEVTSITAPARGGMITVASGEIEVANLQPYDTDSRRARYALPNTNCSCDTPTEPGPRTIRVLGRPRWVPKVRDEQRMQIENEQAIGMMVQAILLEQEQKFDESIKMADLAAKMVNDELLHRNIGQGVRIQIDRSALNFNKSNTGR